MIPKYLFEPKPTSRVSKAIGQAVVDDYVNNHVTVTELAAKYNLSACTVGRVLKASGVKSEKANAYRFSDADVEFIKRMYLEGELSPTAIAEYFASNRHPIERVLKKAGVFGQINLRSRPSYDYAKVEIRNAICKEWMAVQPGGPQAAPRKLQDPTTTEKQRAAHSGSKHYDWKGGRFERRGYVRVRTPDWHPAKGKRKYLFEHRLVMEQHIGRELLSTELVHHKNGVKNDNRIENLELLTFANHHGCVTCPWCKKDFSIK